VIDLDAIIAKVTGVPSEGIDLDAIIAQVQGTPPSDPPPTYALRGHPQQGLYRLRLSPSEHRALFCLVVVGIEHGTVLIGELCDCLGERGKTTVRQRQAIMQQARDRKLLAMRRIAGTSDMDTYIDQRLLQPVRDAVEEAITSPPCVNPRYRPLEEHLVALAEALSAEGLAQRQYHGGS
jgi:hypothetical protein